MTEYLETIGHTLGYWPFWLQAFYLVYFCRAAQSNGKSLVLLPFGGLLLGTFALLHATPFPEAWRGKLWFNLMPFWMAVSLAVGLLPRLHRADGIWQFRSCSAPFSLFAASCLLQHASFVLLFPITRYVLPEAAQPYITPLLWSQYTTFAPVFWICCHALTALLLFLDNRIGGRPVGRFSGSSLLAALLFSMLLQTAYIINGLLSAAA
ncbi:MAG: hypothetical protein Q4A49_00200 [Neisseria sp.]|nr:hypothetical protein [Neisseria sp.]